MYIMSKWSKKYGKKHPECVMSGNKMIADEIVKDMKLPEWVQEMRRSMQNVYNKGFVDGVKSKNG